MKPTIFIMTHPETYNSSKTNAGFVAGTYRKVSKGDGYSGALTLLKKAGLFNYQPKTIIANDGPIKLKRNVSTKDDRFYSGMLDCIDTTKLLKDLEEKGYAVLNHQKDRNSEWNNKENPRYFSNVNWFEQREIQGNLNRWLIRPELSGQFEPKYARLLTVQETIELADTDPEFKKIAETCRFCNLEIVQELKNKDAKNVLKVSKYRLDRLYDGKIPIPTGIAGFRTMLSTSPSDKGIYAGDLNYRDDTEIMVLKLVEDR